MSAWALWSIGGLSAGVTMVGAFGLVVLFWKDETMDFSEDEIQLGQVAYGEHSRLLENRGLTVLSWGNLERWQRDEWIHIALAVRDSIRATGTGDVVERDSMPA